MNAKSQAQQALLTFYALTAQYVLANICSHDNSICCTDGPCGPGKHLIKGSLDCAPCSLGTYMPMNNHSCISCQSCTKPRSSEKEIVIKNCTATSNTEIGCESGYYLEGGSHDLRCRRCIVCRENEVETSPCGGRSKRVCSSVKLPSSVTDAPTTPLPISTGNRDESDKQAQIPTSETVPIDLDRRNVAPTKDIDQFQKENVDVELIVCAISGSIIAAALFVFFVFYIPSQRRALAVPKSAPETIALRTITTPPVSSDDGSDCFSV